MNLQPSQKIYTSDKVNTQSVQILTTATLADYVASLDNQQQQWFSTMDFTAKSQTMIRIPGANDTESICLGVGEATTAELRDSAAWLGRQLPNKTYEFIADSEQEEDLALGWGLGQYQFDRYLSEKKPLSTLAVSETVKAEVGGVLDGLFLARDLINTPTNDMGPSHLAEVSQQLAKQFNADYSDVLDEQLLDKGFRTIFAVGQAAANRPRLIELNWGNESDPKVTLVGKGVCFDTGGLDIKPSAGMRIMKKDMGGGAHALGLASMIMALGLKVRLRVLVPAVENSISDNATRPGDIIKTYKGTTVEIDNTDAEGRLVLCDALALAAEDEPELLLDFATLTGAARVALGAEVVPFFTDDETLASAIAEHSELVDDPLWRLPLYKGYEKQLKSPVADMSNMGKGPFGGAITAALFLKHFVPRTIPWAHFDLYGWNMADKPTCTEGGQSMAIHAVFDYLLTTYGN